jgi:hypothetical protein
MEIANPRAERNDGNDVLKSLAVFTSFVLANPLGVIATTAPDGQPEAALVSFAIALDGSLLFNTNLAARKLNNLIVDSRAAAVIGCGGAQTLQVEGKTIIEYGSARHSAGLLYLQQFPGSRALDDAFALVRLIPEWLRSYDTGTEPAHVIEGIPTWRVPE